MAQHLQKTLSCYIPKRYILVFLGFFGMFNVYAMRVNLSVSMVAMINRTESKTADNTTRHIACAMLQDKVANTSYVEFKGEQYNWDAKTEGMLLSAFFYGYMITQIPGGFLSEKFGAKWVFGGGVFTTSCLTLLTPVSARAGTSVFTAVRILEGLGEGVTFPAMNFIISQWSPLLERSRLSTIIFMGAQVGNVVSLPVSGWLSSTDMLGGWPSSFYVFGIIGCVWFLFWAYLVYESPYVHPTISEEELAYFRQYNDGSSQKKPPLPWKQIFTSLPMWAVLVAHVGHNLGLTIFLTELPNYLSSILHFNIQQNGALSALPFIAQASVACLISFVADKLRSSGTLSITWIRKMINCVGLLGPAVSLLCITISGCRAELVVGLLTLTMALNGFVYSGFHITHVDMSPDFSGTLYGITNSCANLCGVIVPAIVGAVTADGATIASWNKVLYITSTAYGIGAIFYLLFGSAEEQPWGRGSKEMEENGTPMTLTMY